jgi:hypothetical protein
LVVDGGAPAGRHSATTRGARDRAPDRLDGEQESIQMRVLDEYFGALRTQSWKSLAICLAEDVLRIGPYLDVVQGRHAYVEFLSKVIPTLKNYELEVARVRSLNAGSAVVELSEFADVDGVRREFPEVLLVDFDEGGAIERLDIYIKQQPPRPQSGASTRKR